MGHMSARRGSQVRLAPTYASREGDMSW
jgi:hypothetical protein